ncbi:uncharacterized protein LOC117221032 isoform X4 [Megalopta genalis]|uniref:uncharacterized protein LOC117221032 isoform X4 n=1 Tax=Megalopta genalis TaxID=115081 RepID=UPI0014432688|nr:uncharacterized protein LOC117221032 isoform X4 [Megalopta genalis]
MDETYFDEGPAGNFETTTLEISKHPEGNEQNQSTSEINEDINTARRNLENQGNTFNQIPITKDVSNIPFKHIDIHSFFSDRNEVVEKALKDCQDSLINEEEKDLAGSWLLTEKRSMYGVRLLWNKGDPLPLTKKWNPFAKNIPWLTYSSHPLFWYKGSEAEKAKFDVEGLHSTILTLLPVESRVKTGSIVIENYFGLGALVHNRNGLGFFKIRGKVSF